MAKIITTIEGGAVFTNSLKYYKKLLILRNIGETPSKKYHHVMLGTNARMTELQAGFGLAQIEKLRYIIKERNRIAKSYDTIFKNISFVKTLGKLRNAKCKFFTYNDTQKGPNRKTQRGLWYRNTSGLFNANLCSTYV